MTEHVEIEQKFDVDEDFQRPDFDGIPGFPGLRAAAPVTHHLSATYFDTPDLSLAAAKITLRRRTGGTDEGWHLKLPKGTDTRREIHAPLCSEVSPDTVPADLAARVAEVTAGAPLAPVAILSTERTVVTLTVDGSAVAEVADDMVTARRLAGSGSGSGSGSVSGEDGPELRWREVEVEVPRADPALQEAVAAALKAAGARPAGHASKLARVLDS
jgi:hypothetical protein